MNFTAVVDGKMFGSSFKVGGEDPVSPLKGASANTRQIATDVKPSNQKELLCNTVGAQKQRRRKETGSRSINKMIEELAAEEFNSSAPNSLTGTSELPMPETSDDDDDDEDEDDNEEEEGGPPNKEEEKKLTSNKTTSQQKIPTPPPPLVFDDPETISEEDDDGASVDLSDVEMQMDERNGGDDSVINNKNRLDQEEESVSQLPEQSNLKEDEAFF